MKTRLLIIIGTVVVIASIVGVSVASPSINNFDDFVYQLKEPFDNAGVEQIGEYIEVKQNSLEQLQRVLNYCEEKRQAEASNWIRPDGTDWAMITIGLEWHNSTHYIDNNGCMWEDTTTEVSSITATFDPKIYPLPFGYDPASGSGCLSYYHWNGTTCALDEIYKKDYGKYLDENNYINFGMQYSKNGIIIDPLQRILDYCNYNGEKNDHTFFDYANSTHYIDSNDCKFQEIRETPISFRDASGEIICKGYSSGGGFFEYPECGPIDQFVIHVLIIVLPVAGIVIGFVIWRTRK